MKQFYETYKDDEFVSTLLSQISWTMVADYTLQLPDKKLLEEKLREITMLADGAEED